VTGTGGVGAGVINLTGSSGRLTLLGSQTHDNATVRLARSSLTAANNGTTTAVTLGANLTIVTSAAGGGGSSSLNGSTGLGDSLTNKGTILDDTPSGTFSIGTGNNISSLASVDIWANTLSNAGAINVNAGSNLTLENGNWLNTGAGKLVSNNGSVHLGGTITQATLKQVTRTGGELEIMGLLNNAGTLNVGTTASTFGVLTLSGGIAGGTIHDGGGGIVFGSPNGSREFLSNLTYQGE
jgi:hypothetical protein